MIFNKNTAKKTVELLLQINAIKLEPKNPFTWASGWQSPIYCDNRIILSFPEVRHYIKEAFANHIKKQFGTPDVIAGVATGAIGIGALVAEIMQLPFVYVRPEPKKHGRQNQIEGFLEQKQRVVVIEDLISTGNSSLMAVAALKAAGAQVMGMAAIFNYGFDVATTHFKKAEIPLYSLSNYENLLEQAVAQNYITKSQQKTLREWCVSPATWNVQP